MAAVVEIIDCAEFSELSVPIDELLYEGKLELDPRLNGRGYLGSKIKGNQLVLSTTKFVGLFPLTRNHSVRVRPRTPISNLSLMLVSSGIAPKAVEDFSQGYLPWLSSTPESVRLLSASFLKGVDEVVYRGLAKEYVNVPNPAPWRGRLLPSRTVSRHASRGIRYRHEFDQKILSPSTVGNIALKEALSVVHDTATQAGDGAGSSHASSLAEYFGAVSDWDGDLRVLVLEVGRLLASLPTPYDYYRTPLWEAYLILQHSIPDVSHDGFVEIDSLIVDVSRVFEFYVRGQLLSRLVGEGIAVTDGNLHSRRFFVDSGRYAVHPDIVLSRKGSGSVVLDVKYKPKPDEKDRYELLSFMDAFGATVGGFVAPLVESGGDSYMGKTRSGRAFHDLRFDLGAANLSAECDRLAAGIVELFND